MNKKNKTIPDIFSLTKVFLVIGLSNVHTKLFLLIVEINELYSLSLIWTVYFIIIEIYKL